MSSRSQVAQREFERFEHTFKNVREQAACLQSLLRAASTVYQDDLKARGGNVTSEQADAARELSAEERAVNTVRCGAVWCWRMA